MIRVIQLKLSTTQNFSRCRGGEILHEKNFYFSPAKGIFQFNFCMNKREFYSANNKALQVFFECNFCVFLPSNNGNDEN